MTIETNAPVTPQNTFAFALAVAGQLVAALSSPPADCSIKCDYQGGHFLDLHFYNNPAGVAEIAALHAARVETEPHQDTRGVICKTLHEATFVTEGGTKVRAWALMDAKAGRVAA